MGLAIAHFSTEFGTLSFQFHAAHTMGVTNKPKNHITATQVNRLSNDSYERSEVDKHFWSD
jgi:hypothetical protein